LPFKIYVTIENCRYCLKYGNQKTVNPMFKLVIEYFDRINIEVGQKTLILT